MQEKHPGKSISSKGTALVHVPLFGPTRMRRNPKQKFITGGLFMIRGSSTIYFGESHYWDIEELTSTKFAVYNRFGEYGSLHMSREYMELSPLK